MGVQVVVQQCVLDTLSVEHAADAVDAEAPEGTFAIAEHQVAHPLELLSSVEASRRISNTSESRFMPLPSSRSVMIADPGRQPCRAHQ